MTAMPQAAPLDIRRDRGALIITINRESRRNALDRATVQALGTVGRGLISAGDRAVILTGSGSRAFCAGADLKERSGMSESEVRAQLQLYRSELLWLTTSPVPTVAAINGVALGGGLELALLCDLRLCSPQAVLGLPETSLGIIPAAGGTQTLPRIVGPAVAREMILLGKKLSAAEAYRVGLVHRVVAEGRDVLSDCFDWIEPILEGAPLAQRAALGALRAADELPLLDGLVEEARQYEACLLSRDRREALTAFEEKRKPRFEGR